MFKWTRRIMLLSVVVVVAALVGGDLLAKRFAEQRIASAIRDRTSGVADVEATIHSFPFVGRLLVQGKVSELDIALSGIAGHGVDVARLEARASDITLDRGTLVGKRQVQIKGVDTVTLTATITQQLVPLPDGTEVTITNGRLRLPLPGNPSIPIPDTSLLPCTSTARVQRNAIVMTCVSRTLPQIVIDAVGAASLRR